MIKVNCNLRVLLAKECKNMVQAAQETGIARTTLSKLYHNTAKGVQFETLETLNKIYGWSFSDLFSFTKDNEEKK